MNNVIKTVSNLRAKYDVYTLPVDLYDLAEKAGIIIKEDDFEVEMSGFAYQKAGKKYIGVNAGESKFRKRFTIAHEFGHIFMHRKDQVSYDPSVAIVHFRDEHSSMGIDQKEIEANAFAAELLMPESVVRNEVNKMGGLNVDDEESIRELANRFEVSLTAMTVRLTKLYA